MKSGPVIWFLWLPPLQAPEQPKHYRPARIRIARSSVLFSGSEQGGRRGLVPARCAGLGFQVPSARGKKYPQRVLWWTSGSRFRRRLVLIEVFPAAVGCKTPWLDADRRREKSLQAALERRKSRKKVVDLLPICTFTIKVRLCKMVTSFKNKNWLWLFLLLLKLLFFDVAVCHLI